MEMYKKNLTTIKKFNMNFYKLVKESKDLTCIKVEKLIEEKNLIVENTEARCFLHSIYDKTREMEKMFRDVDKKTGMIIIFGVGCGYVFDYIEENFKEVDKIIIIEPSLSIFKNFLEYKDIEKLLKKYKNIDFIINNTKEEAADALTKMIIDNISKKIGFVSNISYRTIFNDYYNKLNEISSKQIHAVTSNATIGNAITYKKLINIMSNIEKDSISIEGLMEEMAGKPVIMVSAGPSINKNLHLLEEAKRKAFVIAVGSAISILDTNDIKPHLRAAFSPNEDEIKVFRNLKNKEIPLIHTDMLYKEVLRNYEGKNLKIIAHNNYLSKYINKKSEVNQVEVLTELTVANTIFELICMTNCSEVILVGQDMAYTDKQQYGAGAWLQNTIENTEQDVFIKAKDMFGKETITIPAFIQIKEAFERRINFYKHTGIKFFNATEGGLHITGTEIITLKQKLDQLKEIPNIDETINQFLANEKSFNQEILVDAIRNIKEELTEVYNINEERVKKLQEFIKIKEVNDDIYTVQRLLKEYNKINEIEDKLKSINIYNDVIQHELDNIYDTVVSAYKYDGKDLKKQLEAVESILTRTSLEVQKYCVVLKYLIFEYEKNKGLIGEEEKADDKLFS